jgi:GT2 family glycosyltransferase
MAEKLSGGHHCKLIENKTNLGFAKGCNQESRRLRRAVLLLNNDAS